MRKNGWITGILVAALLTASTALAAPSSTRFFDYSSGRKTAGIFTSFSDDISFFFGQARFKPASAFEAGFKLGVADVDEPGGNSTTGAYLGIDGNVEVTSMEVPFPADVYLNLGFSSILKSRRALNEFFFGAAGVTDLSSSDLLTIRGELGGEVSLTGGSLADSDDVEVYATGGLTFNLGEGANIFLQVKAGTEISGGLGINFEF